MISRQDISEAKLIVSFKPISPCKENQMSKKYWTVTEITRLFQVDEQFISQLEKEQIVCSTCTQKSSGRLFSDDELEKMRLAKILIEEMDVNLPGVDIIINMRQSMFDMRKQQLPSPLTLKSVRFGFVKEFSNLSVRQKSGL